MTLSKMASSIMKVTITTSRIALKNVTLSKNYWLMILKKLKILKT
jgi:hypothetical protein